MTFIQNLTGLGLLRIGSGVLGFICFSLGLYSFVESDWKEKDLYYICTLCNSISAENLYAEASFYLEIEILNVEVNCPDISLEVFYIVTIICAFICSSGFIVIAVIWPNYQNGRLYNILDVAFHGIFCPLIIASACTFIYSAAKISQLPDSWRNCEENQEMYDAQYLTGGKIVAGILALKLGVLYGVLTYNILQEIISARENYYYTSE